MDRHELWKNIDNLKRHLFLKNEVKHKNGSCVQKRISTKQKTPTAIGQA